MRKKTTAQKIKEKIKKRKEFERALLKDMEKNMGKRGMGLMLKPTPPKPPTPGYREQQQKR
tara:strand:+ start:62 stop:244 length:183 start_codon:yes stop_codon:yes gene_type:complete